MKKIKNKSTVRTIWFEKNKKIIDSFRLGFGLKNLNYSPRSNRNSMKILRKYYKNFDIYVSNYYFFENKKIYKKINKNFENTYNFFNFKKKLLKKKYKLVSSINKNIQIKNIFKPNYPINISNFFILYYNNNSDSVRKINDFLEINLDRNKKLKMLKTIYVNDDNLNNTTDLELQQELSTFSRWGIELGRGGLD